LSGFSQFTIQNLIPKFVHVKPKGKPELVDAFKKGLFFCERISDCSNHYLVFPSEYYSNIMIGLNQPSIPNSAEVWWEMTENRTDYKISPSCEFQQKQN
jgi:hypothetical protein